VGTGAAVAAGGETNEVAQLTVQLTGTLRNLVVLSGHVGLLLKDPHAMATLTALIGRFVSHAELMLNVARILSKLSMDDAARRVLGKDEETLRQLLQLLRVHPDHSAMVRTNSRGAPSPAVDCCLRSRQPWRLRVSHHGHCGGAARGMRACPIERTCWACAKRRLLDEVPFRSDCINISFVVGPHATRELSQVVRVAYIIGNLTVGNSRLRHTVGLRLGGVDLFAALLARYTWRHPPPPDPTTTTTRPAAAAETDEAVLVKVVRVLANLSIHPQVCVRPSTVPLRLPPPPQRIVPRVSCTTVTLCRRREGVRRMRFSVGARRPFKTTSMRPSDAIPVE
jgi:hypothetical protein